MSLADDIATVRRHVHAEGAAYLKALDALDRIEAAVTRLDDEATLWKTRLVAERAKRRAAVTEGDEK